jgi:drug/metabolite transporter (DMT)-like permease
MSGSQLISVPDIAAASSDRPCSTADPVSDTAVPTVQGTSSIAVPALLLGLFAATSYSIANMALRGLSKTDGSAGWDMWIAGTKALPTFMVAVSLLLVKKLRGESAFPAWALLWPIVLTALFNQLGGNLGFQMSLRAIGLAISVPVCFASIICSGAVVGRMVLNDPVSVRTGISMGLMVASIVFLSAAAKARTESHASESDLSQSSVTLVTSSATPALLKPAPLGVPAGIALSVISGLCYGVTGVFIRKAVRSHLSVDVTLFLFSAAGFLVLCPLSLCILPVQVIFDSTPLEWTTIAIAGTFNALGFFAITHAMRHLTISRANVINASQNAMCAIGAVFVFGESLGLAGLIGIGLTIVGLLVLDRR